MAQLQKVHKETIQAQYQEMEIQGVFFTQEIETLKDEIKSWKGLKKEKNVRQ